MSKRDYYEVLDVGKGATASEIKKAYRKIALKYHPDKNPDDTQAEQKFKEAAEAYDILSNPQKRESYDRFGHSASRGGASGFSQMDVEDIFSNFGDIFGGHFSGFSNGGSRSRVRGSDMRIRLKLNLEEIVDGVKKKVKVVRLKQAKGVTYKSCLSCGGAGHVTRVMNTMLGQMKTSVTCDSCRGIGKVIDNRPKEANADGLIEEIDMVSIDIPKGVSDGVQLKITGKGNEAPMGGIPGDLLVLIEEEEHETLKREGDNLHFDLYISFSEAALGCKKEIPTVSGGRVSINIESGVQSGKILRLKGKGIPSLDRVGIGDLLVHVSVWTPRVLSKEQKKFFEKMLEDANFMPSPDQEKSFFQRIREMFS
ncbi:molecular chaperone DnaJ [Ichthyobacterium seriolicida]|uniref:Chaperone protein DnaJ n=1 Tax=Ichthyobacterium seriolicida TaxID=242600 RepID=A0A1J1E7S6_9FLAO|nr:molecular chaperone DnaJ [Ichthyobacterium seriolicida]BAV95390.1 chaperone protein DnaJ [Ichthyobacterium seriolicida]